MRNNPPGSELPYELLVGSRRRFSVNWLNHNGRPEIRLNAMVVDLSDEEAFRLADIENRERQDITELDRARSYQGAVDRFYGGVQSRMAEALNLSNSQLSRLLSLAQMPDEVVDAFATREELRVRHSEVLTPLLRRPEQRDRLLVAARSVGQEQQRLAAAGDRMIPAATVLTRLKQAAMEGGGGRAQDMQSWWVMNVWAGSSRAGTVWPLSWRSPGMPISTVSSQPCAPRFSTAGPDSLQKPIRRSTDGQPPARSEGRDPAINHFHSGSIIRPVRKSPLARGPVRFSGFSRLAGGGCAPSCVSDDLFSG